MFLYLWFSFAALYSGWGGQATRCFSKMVMMLTIKVVLYKHETLLFVSLWVNAPGQHCVLQVNDKDLTPTQSLPPCPGKGFEQVRDWYCRPPPQVLLQRLSPDQALQPPSTMKRGHNHHHYHLHHHHHQKYNCGQSAFFFFPDQLWHMMVGKKKSRKPIHFYFVVNITSTIFITLVITVNNKNYFN